MDNLHYPRLLSKDYPNIMEVSKEIINLKAILALPKGAGNIFFPIFMGSMKHLFI